MVEPAGDYRGLYAVCEDVIPISMNKVFVTVAQLLLCVFLSGGSHVGTQPVRDWKDTFAAWELLKRLK